jgi:hypothetical protein
MVVRWELVANPRSGRQRVAQGKSAQPWESSPGKAALEKQPWESGHLHAANPRSGWQRLIILCGFQELQKRARSSGARNVSR